MFVQHLASGSKGNSIVVDDSYSKIMFDAGLSYKKLSRRVKFSEIEGVFITHEHKDHCKAVAELSRRGNDIYMSWGTANELLADADIGFYRNWVEHGKQIEVSSWIVLPFNVKHDAAEPMGFLFQSRETQEKGVYIADSTYIEFSFKGVQYWLMEANYSEELLKLSGDDDRLKARIRRSHFSLDDLITFFDTSDMSQTKEIHLIHLSDRNSDEEAFKRTLQRKYGVPVYSISDKLTTITN